MAAKTANVTARIQPEIKEAAESILDSLGIPVSVFIDMTYRQVIANNGIPFSLNIPRTFRTLDEMTENEFDQMMEEGLRQAKSGETVPAEDVFSELEKRISE